MLSGASDDRASQFAATLLTTLPLDWLLGEVRRRHLSASLAGATDVQLVAETESRGYRVYHTDHDIELPGLTISPTRPGVHYRDRWYHLSPREIDVVVRIARAYPRPVPRSHIEQSIWGTRDGRNTHSYLRTIRQRVPGLIQPSVPLSGFRSAVALNLNGKEA